MESPRPEKSLLSVRLAATRTVKKLQRVKGFDNRTRKALIDAAVRKFFLEQMH